MTEGKFRLFLIGGGAAAYVILMTLEVVTESDPMSTADFLVDAVTMLLTIVAAACVASIALRAQRQHEERVTLLAELEDAKAEGALFRAAVDHHVSGLKAAIERQFEKWLISPAERDVAFMILKGFSHKEIAALRKTSEATVRQQAQSIYRKSGMTGKNAFAAYFLEDLLAAPVSNGTPERAIANGRPSVTSKAPPAQLAE